jgi:hypothetical protein
LARPAARPRKAALAGVARAALAAAENLAGAPPLVVMRRVPAAASRVLAA